MKVAELIQELQELPPGLEIVVYDQEYGRWHSCNRVTVINGWAAPGYEFEVDLATRRDLEQKGKAVVSASVVEMGSAQWL